MVVFDVEADGLLDEATHIHVLSYSTDEGPKSLTNYNQMRKWLLEQDILIGHNIVQYDIPILEKILKIEIKAQLIDTLALSWYLYDRNDEGDKRRKHGLEAWGDFYGIKKPEIKDWKNLGIQDYCHRCEQDVRINQKLWNDQHQYLSKLYKTKEPENLPIVHYLTFKMTCAKEQEKSQWRVDLPRVEENIAKLSKIAKEKEDALRVLMPPVPKYLKKSYPKKPFKKNGDLSETGIRWKLHLKELGLPEDHKEDIKVFSHNEEPNPNSPDQIKDWLFSLGWEPETFKYVRDKDKDDLRPIPQIKKLMEPDLCDSVKRLIEDHPEIAPLEGLSIVTSRIGNLKAILEHSKDGYVKAKINGLTNTLRFIHVNPCVNLPGVQTLYGQEVRECFIAKDGYELCGSDMTALEDLTKRHYIYDYDPEYVMEMAKPGYDPHLDLALHSGALTPEQVEAHKNGTENHKKIRQDYKKTNYSATYGIGKDKLARELKSTVTKAALLIKDFWKRNWAIKKVAENQKVVIINGQKWIFNPVSKFYYSLRADKDRFSTLNQSTGVYCFDTWLAFVYSKRPQFTAQFHDEVVLEVKKGFREDCNKLLQWAIDKTNEKLKLNIKLSIDIQYGDNYASIH